MTTATVTGITSQDGACLAGLLLGKVYTVYTVYGAFRRTSSVTFRPIEALEIDKHPNFHRIEYDRTDFGSTNLLREKVWCERGLQSRGAELRGRVFRSANHHWHDHRARRAPSAGGDPQKARTELGWGAKISLEELCRMMVEADLIRNSHAVSF